MPKTYTKEELWKVFDKLPDELKEAIFSAQTADNIWNICERNEVEETQKVSELVGHVLLGLLPAEGFQRALEQELQLEIEKAKKVAQEINRFIFYPVKPALDQLYQITTTQAEKKVATTAPTTETPKVIKPIETTAREEQKGLAGKDTYRESIE